MIERLLIRFAGRRGPVRRWRRLLLRLVRHHRHLRQDLRALEDFTDAWAAELLINDRALACKVGEALGRLDEVERRLGVDHGTASQLDNAELAKLGRDA